MYEGVYLYSQRFKRGQGFVTREGNFALVDVKHKNRQLKKLIRWYLRKAKEEESLYEFALDAANALLEPGRTAILESMNRVFVAKGLITYSVMATQYLGRVLTVEERERLASSNLKKREYEEAVRAANLLQEPNRSNILSEMLSLSVSEGHLSMSKDISRSIGRELSVSELKIILSVALQRGAFWRAIQVTREMDRSPTRKEAEIILNVLLKEGYFEESQEVLEYIGRKPTDDEVETLLEGVIDKGFFWYTITLASMFSEPKRTLSLEAFLLRVVDCGDVWRAKEIAGLIGRPLSHEELESMLLTLLKNGDLDKALLVIKEMPESDRFRKVAEIIDSSLNKEEFHITHQAAKAILMV